MLAGRFGKGQEQRFMLTVIFVSIITSAIASFLIGRIYLNAQYYSSNAGYRQLQVISATHEIAGSFQEHGPDIPAGLIAQYRYSLGPLIIRMFHSFGNGGQAPEHDVYPALTLEGEPDSWLFFQACIRPVKIDISNNAFIGWMPFVRNVQLMTTLWNICHIAESIIMEITAIQTIASEKRIPLPYQPLGLSIVFEPADRVPDCYTPHVTTVKKLYGDLRRSWYKWLRLLNR